MDTPLSKLLLVEDDEYIRAALAEQFEEIGEFSVIEAEDGRTAMEIAKESELHVAVLDVGLPDIDGRTLCRSMRRNGMAFPIIMATAYKTDSEKITGLEAGASDYVTKPYVFSILLARVRAQVNQRKLHENAEFDIGPYRFSPLLGTLTPPKGKNIRLTNMESRILRRIYLGGNKTVSRKTLLAEVWGYNEKVSTHTIESHIHRIRQKIEADPANCAILVTDGAGYKIKS